MTILAWLDACKRLGLESAPLLRQTGLSREEINDPERRIPREKAQAVWELSYELSGNPDLALHAAESLDWGAYRVIDFLAANAPTVGAALERIARYFPIIDDLVVLDIVSSGQEVLYRMTAPELPVPLPRPAVEYTLAAIFLRTRLGLAVDFSIERAEFAFEAPADFKEHKRVFDCKTTFGHPVSQLVLSRQTWQLPARQSDAKLFSVLEQHAEHLLRQVSREAGFVEKVRGAIVEKLKEGNPSLSNVAHSLAIGERTLQRRLAEAGAVFANLLDEERKRMAKAFLCEPNTSLAEVAFLLGFSDQSSFSRAFGRWTGISPGRWRAQHSG